MQSPAQPIHKWRKATVRLWSQLNLYSPISKRYLAAPAFASSLQSLGLLRELTADVIPIQLLEKCLPVFRTPVLILQIVSVLPNIHTQHRLVSCRQRAVLVGSAFNGHSTVRQLDQ